MRIFKESELAKLKPFILQARSLWSEASKKEFERIGDNGCCIAGDGIEILYIPKRCRKPVALRIIPSREVAFCQGSAHYENTYHVAKEYLELHGIDCRYNYGRMD